jgi:hypothetical protein
MQGVKRYKPSVIIREVGSDVREVSGEPAGDDQRRYAIVGSSRKGF